MTRRFILHIVEPDSRMRAELVRLTLAAGEHAEGYDDLQSLIDHKPRDGAVVLSFRLADDQRPSAVDRLGEAGLFLPIVRALHSPSVSDAIEAVQGGAIDVLCLPPEPGDFARMLRRVIRQAEGHLAVRQRMEEARHQLATLTRRERQVLYLLSQGRSNKVIAIELAISPRTVEVHRANMMLKLGARHAADALRLRLDAGLEPDLP